MAGLSQLLKFLERDDVEELILQTGKAVTARIGGQLRPLGAMPVSSQQMEAILSQNEIAGVEKSGNSEPVSIEGHGYFGAWSPDSPVRIHAQRPLIGFLRRWPYSSSSTNSTHLN